MIKSELITTLLPALVSAKQKFGIINKNKKAYGYKYATIDEILDKIEKPLLEAGLFIAHDRDIEKMELTSYVYHTSGEYIGTKIKLDVEISNKMNFMQNLGSASTYAIRYNLIALFNLCAEEDDDGVASNKPKQVQVQEVKKPKEAPTPSNLELEIQQIIPFIAKFGIKEEVSKLCGLNIKTWTQENVDQIKSMLKEKRKESEPNN